MKRDMDLARNIMLALEESTGPELVDVYIEVYVKGHTPEEISYHVMLLHEAGLIKALDASSFGEYDWRPERLTWEGHEFLESSRDEGVWKKAKKIMAEKAGGIPFEALKQVLIQLAKDAVSGP